MNVSLFGLGYVGCVTAACLAAQGHKVIGVDVVADKVNAIKASRWPIFEPGLDELDVLSKGLITAGSDAESAVLSSDITLVCVGTPSSPDGSVDTAYLERSCGAIASAIAGKKSRHLVLIRSTVPPGTVEGTLLPIFGPHAKSFVAFCPEFLREGTAINDFFNPSLNVLGADPSFPVDEINRMLPDVKLPAQVVSIKAAETIKYANNSFHALKIVFTNEFAQFCKAYGVDGTEVMEIFCQDRVLNLSPYYLRPGFAYGGSCLPKELRAVTQLSKARGLDPILFEAIPHSNDELIASCIKLLYSFKPTSIGYFGAAFKPNTDDLRESSVMRVIEAILVRNRSYSKALSQYVLDCENIRTRLLSREREGLFPVESADELIAKSDVIVLATWRIDEALQRKLVAAKKPVVDLKWFKVCEALKASAMYRSLV